MSTDGTTTTTGDGSAPADPGTPVPDPGTPAPAPAPTLTELVTAAEAAYSAVGPAEQLVADDNAQIDALETKLAADTGAASMAVQVMQAAGQAVITEARKRYRTTG